MGEKIKLDSKVGKLSDIGKLIKPGLFKNNNNVHKHKRRKKKC